MKNLAIVLTLLIVPFLNMTAQVSYESNDPLFGSPLGYIGWNDNTNEDLDFFQNNSERLRMTSVTWPGYNGASALPNASRMYLGINGNQFATTVFPPVELDPFSLLHMGYNINNGLRRPWMNVGITYGAGRDIMYTGVIQSPGSSNNGDITDAVIVWGCNDSSSAVGPDNLRFLFISPTTDITQPPSSAPEGLETMRITPWGNVGIGDSFSNALQPHRRTVVHQRTDSAQFRIAHTVNTDPILGAHADFQVGSNGNFYLKPRANGNARPTAIGFLRGEDSDSPMTSFTRLDVGGITRIRKLPNDTARSCLIIGTIADTSSTTADRADHYLSRIDFTGDTTDVLSGDGTWVQANSLGDCRWEDINSGTISGNTDIRTGWSTNSDCYRDKVSIGIVGNKDAKLEVASLRERDKVNTAIYARATGLDSEGGGAFVTSVLGETIGETGVFNTSTVLVGVDGSAGKVGEAARQNVGVRGEASATQGGQAIGVYAKAEGTGQQIGLYAEGNQAILYFGGAGGTGFPITLSDASLKSEIATLEGATEILNQLSAKTYFMNNPDNRNLYLDEGLQFGFLAQEIQEVLPDIVKS
jgi:hypothetical protein